MSTNEDDFEYSPRSGSRPRTTGPDLMSMGCILPPIPSTKVAKSSYYYHDTVRETAGIKSSGTVSDDDWQVVLTNDGFQPDETVFDCFSYYVEGRHANNSGTSQELVEELFAKLNKQDQKDSSEFADAMRKRIAVDKRDAGQALGRPGNVVRGEYGRNQGLEHDDLSKVKNIPSLHRKDRK